MRELSGSRSDKSRITARMFADGKQSRETHGGGWERCECRCGIRREYPQIGWQKNHPKLSVLKPVLQAGEVEMPELGGALIPGDEKPFPESGAGRMDPAGWSKTGMLAFLLLTAFPFRRAIFIILLGL